jgi:opacity protein-like surface antigen
MPYKIIMKKFLLVITVILSAFSAFAQDSAVKQDTTKVAPAPKKKGPTEAELEQRKKMDKMYAKYSRDHITLDLLGTNWNYNPNGAGFGNGVEGAGMRTKWFSRGIQLAFNWDFRIKGSRVSIAPGISYSCSNIYSRSTQSRTDTGFTVFNPIRVYGTDTTAKINKVVLQYVNIPLEIRIRSNIDKFGNCFKGVIGIVGGVRVDEHTKFKIKQGDDTNVYIVRRDPDYNLFRLAPMARFGYSFFNVTASYDVINVFQPGKGPKANAFALGISFTAL